MSGLRQILEPLIPEEARRCPGCPDCDTQMQDLSIAGYAREGEAVRHREGCSHDDPSGSCCFGEVVRFDQRCGGSGLKPSR